MKLSSSYKAFGNSFGWFSSASCQRTSLARSLARCKQTSIAVPSLSLLSDDLPAVFYGIVHLCHRSTSSVEGQIIIIMLPFSGLKVQTCFFFFFALCVCLQLKSFFVLAQMFCAPPDGFSRCSYVQAKVKRKKKKKEYRGKKFNISGQTVEKVKPGFDIHSLHKKKLNQALCFFFFLNMITLAYK